MERLAVVVPGWVVESGEISLVVDELWQVPLVGVPAASVSPADFEALHAEENGSLWPADDVPGVGPAYGWVASSVAMVPSEQRVAGGNLVGHLPLTAMHAGWLRFAIEGTYEGRWCCEASVFQHLPQVLDATSPIAASAMMDLRVKGLVRIGPASERRTPVASAHGWVDEDSRYYVVDVEPWT